MITKDLQLKLDIGKLAEVLSGAPKELQFLLFAYEMGIEDGKNIRDGKTA